jgi:hypothetical protein
VGGDHGEGRGGFSPLLHGDGAPGLGGPGKGLPAGRHPRPDREGNRRLRLNYILRQGADVLFDFSVGGIKIPLGTSPEKFNLILPRSEQRAGGGDTYSAFVRKGKNQISIDEQDLGKRPLEKSFSWEWKSQQWISREKGVVLVASSHKAAVTVTLIPHD